jgi:hypothetical protein
MKDLHEKSQAEYKAEMAKTMEKIGPTSDEKWAKINEVRIKEHKR